MIATKTATKTETGRFFEDFAPGERLHHATPRTVTSGDVALALALTGSRHALYSASTFAKACGLAEPPVDPLLVFHIVFGKSVPDISLNAVANLGYAEGRFLAPVQVGDTLSAASEVLGVKETSNGKTGVVYVRTTGRNQTGRAVLSYVRWVLVRKRNAANPAPPDSAPRPRAFVPGTDLVLPEGLDFTAYDFAAAGAAHAFEDYHIGERIDHVDGMVVEEAEAQMATRLYQNTAKVHFNQFERMKDPSGRRLVYGGVVISTARALSFNGLENAGLLLGINAGRHVNPYFAGATLFAWSEVLDTYRFPDRDDVGALRLRLVATKDAPCANFPDKTALGEYPAEVVLDFDYWVGVPCRG